ncbi:hypothetical protein HX787_28580 [Pseudomonas tolaasii]|uniref:Uncharacterized protein n=2 Tax=Pseudomonas tolaasii TaxID=29442 RepID=A0A7Y8AVX7_PSETO|nr:hypothetical protein [Pseudomonas tolaasii]KAB0466568.1 hypothetical protein F7R12_27760 [Pseudomonas tolaasii]MBY8943444.1 hypothetical protein [Pseudomonas tolaasii]NVZ45462.1 hypothetical protein [Pseudomonas tolaasii]NWA48558.1 hypothetical protein [Pseudomonas tolaasii]NWC24005.1 hypothetical protein [Pseudomonas tolaasii]
MDNKSLKLPHSKTFYRPIEVAIRWCDLLHLEAQIVSEADHLLLQRGYTHSYPCIQQKLEILWDAIRHQELPYGCLGVTVSSSEHVEPALLTIRHTDLKNWFTQFLSGEKPAFLFNDLERKSVLPETSDTYNFLLTEIEIYKIKQARTQSLLLELQEERDSLREKNIALTSELCVRGKPSERSQKNYLRLIGALLKLMLGKSPGGRSYSTLTSQASIISALIAHNRNKPGFSQRTLEEKFAAAKRCIDDFE